MTEHLARPLERLAEVAQDFIHRQPLRALVVATDGHLRPAALRVLLSCEHLANNRSPFFAVELGAPEAEWDAMEAALRREHERMRGAKVPLRELTAEVAGTGAARFAARLRNCEGTVEQPAQGMVLLLVCTASRLESTWLEHLREMILDPVLQGVRFIVQVSTCATAWEWAERLPADRCVRHQCVVDPEAAADALEKEVEREASSGATGTWPADEAPPTERAHELTTPARDPAAKPATAPVSGSERPEPAETDAICAKRAVVAMSRGDGPEAARQQARARDLCVADGRLEDAVRMELVLGGYMLDLHETRQAQSSFDRAARMASEIPAHGLEAQARYAEAWTWREQQQVDAMMRSYWAGIDAAKRGGEPRLAFEGYWGAGRVLQPLDRRNSALVSLWSDAIAYANTLEPAQLEGTRLPQIADGLADVLRSMRRPADARAIEEWAEHALGDTDAPDPNAPPTVSPS